MALFFYSNRIRTCEEAVSFLHKFLLTVSEFRQTTSFTCIKKTFQIYLSLTLITAQNFLIKCQKNIKLIWIKLNEAPFDHYPLLLAKTEIN